jgi:Cu+-exporting ATPase
MPVTKETRGKVIAGTLNQSGSFRMRADKVGRDTLLSQIVKMVAAQRRADPAAGRSGRRLVRAGRIVVALIAFGVWQCSARNRDGVRSGRRRQRANHRRPCALGPPPRCRSWRRRTRRVRPALIRMPKRWSAWKDRHAVVDKTGTLTEGKPKVVSIVAAGEFHEADILRLAASVERASEHPLADAIVRAARERNLDLGKVEEFDSPTGKGATSKVDGKTVVLGNANFLTSLGIETRSLEEQGERLRGEGAPSSISRSTESSGLFAIADPVKPSTPDALKALAADGIKVIMLTGDNRTTAKAVARKLGISDVEAEVLPDQKSAVVARLQQAGRVVAMAGDGVNDAPALAAAEVGIAMGTGTDVAMESAGITLLGGDLGGIVRARRLSQATMSNIRQNLFFAFIYNAAGIPIAAGILYPHFGILLSPIIAAAAMALSSVSVVGNALRLRVTRL